MLHVWYVYLHLPYMEYLGIYEYIQILPDESTQNIPPDPGTQQMLTNKKCSMFVHQICWSRRRTT